MDRKIKTQPFPGAISRVVAQQTTRRNLGPRVNVFIDEKFSFAISADLVFKHGLRPGLLVDETFLAELLREDGETKALFTAISYIGVRARSTKEITARLERDEWSETVIQAVLEKLRDLKLVDDAQFAANWVENRSQFKPKGARMLQQELRLKGIAREEIEAALPDGEAEIENALLALQKLERKLEKYEGRERQQKAIELLARRGFGYGAAKAAIQRQIDLADEE